MIFICLVIYVIYFFYHDDRLHYLAIGDSLSVGVNAYGETSYGYSDYIASYLERNHQLKSYYKDFSVPGYRISDLQHQLDTNQLITVHGKTLSFKKCLRESELVTLSIGGNDLLSELSLSTVDIDTLDEDEVLQIIDQVTLDLETLLKSLRKYAKREIIMIGYYNPLNNSSLNLNRIFSYLNQKVASTCRKYDIDYINIYSLFKNNRKYLPNPTNIHPNTEGYEAIANKVIAVLEKQG